MARRKKRRIAGNAGYLTPDPFVLFMDQAIELAERRLGPSSPSVASLRAFRDDYLSGRTDQRAFATVLYNGRLAGRVPEAEIDVFERDLFRQIRGFWPPCDLVPPFTERLRAAVADRLGEQSPAAQLLSAFERAYSAGTSPTKDPTEILEDPSIPEEHQDAIDDLVTAVSRQIWDPPPVPQRNRPLP